MKILHCVEHFPPHQGGMAEVVRQLSACLALCGHNLHVACSEHPRRSAIQSEGIAVHSFAIQGNSDTGIVAHESEISRYKDFVLSGEFDIVTCFAAHQWSTDLLLDILPEITAKKVFVPTGFTGIDETTPYFQKMRVWLGQFDHIVFLSSDYYDINFTRRLGFTHWSIIPNGCSLSEFSAPKSQTFRAQLRIPKKNRLLLHVGSHTTMKGHDELYALFRAARLPNATLLVVGNFLDNPRPGFIEATKALCKYFLGYKMGCSMLCKLLHHPFFRFLFRLLTLADIRVVQLSRPDLVQAYLHADLFVFPSNIECSPIVLFESIAAGTYFLASQAGNASEIISWFGGGGRLFPGNRGADGKVYIDIAKSVGLLQQVVKNLPYLQNDLEHARTVWTTSYTWEALSGRYEELYKGLVASA